MRLPGAALTVAVALGLASTALAAPAGSLPEDHGKMVTARRVLDDIVSAAGDGRTPPSLRIVPRTARRRVQVAWFSPHEHAVVVEERAYDVCTGLGADSLAALAVLIGHELAHFYQDHDWAGDFGNDFADLEVGQRVLEAGRARQYEAEADVFGGFYGYLAGYNTLGVSPRLLWEIYAAFELDEGIEGYPGLSDRQDIARRSEARLAELVPVFETAGHLLVIGRHDLAAEIFDFLARDFPSREILSNAGVALARAALETCAPGEVRFALPFDLDAETRLRQAALGRRGAGGDPDRRRQLLEEARRRFDEARRRDPTYLPVLVHLASLDWLGGRGEAALSRVREAERRSEEAGDRVTAAHARIVRGICLAGDRPSLAREAFEAARSGDPVLAQMNLDALVGTSPPAPAAAAVAGPREPRVGPGSAVYAAILARPASWELSGVGSGGPAPMIVYADLGDQRGYVVDTGQSTIVLVSTAPGYRGRTARGVSVGDGAREVRQRYGEPVRVVPDRRGTHLVYQGARITFRLDPDGLVAGWLQYDAEEDFYAAVRAPHRAGRFGPRVALVMGNDAYAEAPLRNAVADAVAMGRALRQAGFEVVESVDADRRAMTEAIRRFGDELASRRGVGLFYYAGHGVQVDRVNYLVPVGSDIRGPDEVPDECVSVDRVVRKMKAAGNGVNILILDACRNNPYGGSRSGGTGLASLDVRGTYVAFATEAGKVAADAPDREHSVFTGALLHNLLVPGQEIEHLFYAVKSQVAAATGGAQFPLVRNQLTGPFYFVPAAADVAGGNSTAPPPGPSPGTAPTPDRSDMVFVEDAGFYIDRHEVTNAAFAEFLWARGNAVEDGRPWLDMDDENALIEDASGDFQARPGYGDHPVVEVTWHGARRYCEWRGKRLPTSQEWDRAATGADGRRFPWGDRLASAAAVPANFRQEGDGYERTAPVGAFPQGSGPYGAVDMAGNVWEWVADADGTRRLVLGGSWDSQAELFGTPRWIDAATPNEFTGFRCAGDP